MKNKLIFVSIIVILFLSLTQATLAQSTTTLSVIGENQIQVLEKEIDLLNEINSKILNTIYWALSGLITIFLAIVGLNFFQNFTINKRKLDSIKQEIKQELDKEKNEIESQSNNLLSKLQEQNKKNLAELSGELQSKIKSTTQPSFNELKDQVHDLQENYEEIKRENLIRAAFEYKEKNQMGYILNLVQVLELDIIKNWDWRINESLDYISKCLDEGNKNSDSLTALQKALNKLPAQFSAQKIQIEKKMNI